MQELVRDTAQGQRVQSDILAEAEALDYSDADLHALRLGIEEALVNAIKHGNGSDVSKGVAIEYEITKDHARVRITDEGIGFDHRNLPDPTAPENLERPCGRGVMLMREYMNAVFNDRGNSVELVRWRTPKLETDPSPEREKHNPEQSSVLEMMKSRGDGDDVKAEAA